MAGGLQIGDDGVAIGDDGVVVTDADDTACCCEGDTVCEGATGCFRVTLSGVEFDIHCTDHSWARCGFGGRSSTCTYTLCTHTIDTPSFCYPRSTLIGYYESIKYGKYNDYAGGIADNPDCSGCTGGSDTWPVGTDAGCPDGTVVGYVSGTLVAAVTYGGTTIRIRIQDQCTGSYIFDTGTVTPADFTVTFTIPDTLSGNGDALIEPGVSDCCCPTDCSACTGTLNITVSGTSGGSDDGTWALTRSSCTWSRVTPTVTLACTNGRWRITKGSYTFDAYSTDCCPPLGSYTQSGGTAGASASVAA